MTHKTSGGGSFRLDRRFKGVGRIALASGTKNRQQFQKYNAMLTELYEAGKLEILRAIRDRRVSIQQVYQAKRANQLPYLVSGLLLQANLWSEVEAWLPHSAPAPASRKRYAVSFKSLRQTSALSDQILVSELADVNWRELQEIWRGGPADWNRMRAAVSRFLTMTLRDKYHPFRRQVMYELPRAREPLGRVPELDVPLLWRIVNAAPAHVGPCYVTLAATGMRAGEFLALKDHHLRPITMEIEVPGTKTASSSDIISVGPKVWPYVVRAVPSPVRYKWLYTHWKRACQSQNVSDLTLHDLRHFFGQELIDYGVPEPAVQQGLRHSDPNQTRRYTKKKDRGENAAAMDNILFGNVA